MTKSGQRKGLLSGVIFTGVMAVAGIASAHATVASASCEGGVVWNAHDYEVQQTNSIVVKVDGNTVYTNPSFGTTNTGNSVADKTKSHTWSVVVNAPGTQYDYNLHGEFSACREVPPTTTVAPTTTIPATTTTVTPTTTQPAVTTTVPVTTDAPTTTQALVPTTPVTPPVPTVQPPATRVSDVVVLPATGRGDHVRNVGAIAMLAGIVLCLIAIRRKPVVA